MTAPEWQDWSRSFSDIMASALLVPHPRLHRASTIDMATDSDDVVARVIGRGTHAGTFGGVAPTVRRIATQELVTSRFAEGKIVGCWGDLFPVVRDALTTTGTVTT